MDSGRGFVIPIVNHASVAMAIGLGLEFIPLLGPQTLKGDLFYWLDFW